jgi:hypothetical protein
VLQSVKDTTLTTCVFRRRARNTVVIECVQKEREKYSGYRKWDTVSVATYVDYRDVYKFISFVRSFVRLFVYFLFVCLFVCLFVYKPTG